MTQAQTQSQARQWKISMGVHARNAKSSSPVSVLDYSRRESCQTALHPNASSAARMRRLTHRCNGRPKRPLF
eukprot:2768036-Pleurochrysis_carterae.AAC.1